FIEPLLILRIEFLQRAAHFLFLLFAELLRSGWIFNVRRLLRQGRRARDQDGESSSKEGLDYPGHMYTSTARRLENSNARSTPPSNVFQGPVEKTPSPRNAKSLVF